MAGTEAVQVRRLAQFLVFQERGADFIKLSLKFRMVGRKGNEAGKGTGSVFIALLFDEPSGRFWEEDHAGSKNEAPDELNCDWNLPCSVGGLVLCGIIDDGGNEETNGDRPLVAGNDGPTVLRKRRSVMRCCDGDE